HRPRDDESCRRHRNRGRKAVEPPHGDQSHSEHSVTMAARRKNSLWSIRQPIPRGVATALAFVMPIVVLAAWCVISYGHLAPGDFLPSPTEVVRGTLQLFIQYDLLTAVWVSTRRILFAFLLASACALP